MSISNVSLPDALQTPWCALPGAVAAGSEGYLTIQNGGSVVPGTPDQQFELRVSADPSTKDLLIIRGQAGGPSPAVDCVKISPAGNLSIAGGFSTAGPMQVTGALTAGSVQTIGSIGGTSLTVNGAITAESVTTTTAPLVLSTVFAQNSFPSTPLDSSLSATPVTSLVLTAQLDTTTHKIGLRLNAYSAAGAFLGAYDFVAAY